METHACPRQLYRDSEDTVSLPSLRNSIKSIKRLRTEPDLIAKDKADFFVSSVAFLCHLKRDQAKLYEIWNQRADGDKYAICPPPASTPAIAALLEDPGLFRSILSLLRSKMHVESDSIVSATSMPNTPQTTVTSAARNKSTPQLVGNRKRSASVSLNELGNENPSKSAKIHQSPTVTTERNKSASGVSMPVENLLDFDPSVFAATVFFSTFQHMDHWPVALVKAFAEDSFGPRRWVDDERCSPLTENLGLAVRDQNGSQDEQSLSSAEKYAQYYDSLMREKDHEGHNELDVSSAADSTKKPVQKDNTSASVSESGGEECILEVSSGVAQRALAKQQNALAANDSDSSSSGDEEEVEEEVLVANAGSSPAKKKETKAALSTMPADSASEEAGPESSSFTSSIAPSPMPSQSELSADAPYAWYQKYLDMTRIRPRFVGRNCLLAHQSISDALSQRLDAKAKQNSRLLSTLPTFMSVPGVRSLSAGHLERWLQSPALSGLGRAVFSSIVSEVQNIDEDRKAIDSILSMKLKANQLSAHIDNVTRIAKNVPTQSVAHQIFLHLLRSELAELDDNGSRDIQPKSSPTDFFVAIHSNLPPNVAANAMASAVLELLSHSQDMEKLIVLLRTMVFSLGSSYNGRLLVRAILQSREDIHGVRDAEGVARLTFECMTLMAPLPQDAGNVGGYNRQHLRMKKQATSTGNGLNENTSTDGIPEDVLNGFAQDIAATKKSVLHWCVNTFANISMERDGSQGSKNSKEQHRKPSSSVTNNTLVVGAGVPVYDSVLDGQASQDSKSAAPLMKAVRCLLFLVGPDSPELNSFLSALKSPLSHEQSHRIRLCCAYGSNIDDEVMWIVLKSADLDTRLALILIENLFMNCRRGKSAKLCITDLRIPIHLYNLVEYHPVAATERDVSSSSESDSSDQDGSVGRKRKAFHLEKGTNGDGNKDSKKELNLPRLAFPGMWWRVTALILAMCGASPDSIGAEMWQVHPTIQAMIKMTTSGRYRFPTADCDEDAKETMKNGEAALREQEQEITKQLFLPKSSRGSGKKRKLVKPAPVHSGSRMSARQREKQKRLLALQQEQEKNIALAEAQRVKKLLRAAQKSIMIWDPQGPARKPPKESVNLILSVSDLFGLSDTFRLCSEPDYLLRTIGGTSRGAIERSADWLIPIISSHPETINRLPSSASCFLLLRAYGTDRDQNDQLLDLSKPLLRHVKSCLGGEFGEADSLRAADLLLIDAADQSPDRRHCAKKVLQEAIGANEVGAFDDVDFSWIFNLLRLPHAVAIVDRAIKHLSHALVHERGRVLRALVLGLHKYIEFAKENNGDSWDFDKILVELISVRSHICSSVMDRFDDFRDLCVCTVNRGFKHFVGQCTSGSPQEPGKAIKLTLCQPGSDSENSKREIIIPAPLLYAALVVLSNWQGTDEGLSSETFVANNTTKTSDSKDAVMSLVNYLIIPHSPGDENGGLFGAAGAVFAINGRRAVAVEHWVMMAKSRCDFIARNAALSAPDTFLPRLLLCSGLPSVSLFSMLERLGQLGESRFSQLLSPSAAAEWGFGNLSKRRVIARKLLGRITAYLEIDAGQGSNPAVHSSFVTWLIEECRSNEKVKKTRAKKTGFMPKSPQKKMHPSVSSLVSVVETDSSDTFSGVEEEQPKEVFSLSVSKHATKEEGAAAVLSASVVEKICNEGDFVVLEEVLEQALFSLKGNQESQLCDVARTLIFALDQPSELVRIALKWIPLLTQTAGNSAFWEALFLVPSKSVHGVADFANTLISRCAGQWEEAHILQCQEWILSQVDGEMDNDNLSLTFMLRFFVITSGQESAHTPLFTARAYSPVFASVSSQSRAAAAISLSLKCADEIYGSDNSEMAEHTSRNMLPDWLNLVLVLGRCSKKHLVLITKTLLCKLPSQNWEGKVLPATLLRLYVYYPSMMDLGDAKLRKILLDAAKALATEWLDWRCPLDEQLDDLVMTLPVNPNQRLLQSITELSKRHPLIVMRQLKAIVEILQKDGAVSQQDISDKRGRINGGDAVGVAIAKTQGRVVKVTVQHWGYSFTEPVWASILEVMSSLPSEVIFSCGCQMGLLDLFNEYVKLIAIQREIKSAENTSRIRAKLVTLLAAFKDSDTVAWQQWMEGKVKGIKKAGSVQELAKKCDFELPEVPQRANTV